jgi:hypothetical protein
MKVEIKDNAIMITLPLQTPTLSKSGKSHIVATTNGFVSTEVTIKDKPVKIAVNVII